MKANYSRTTAPFLLILSTIFLFSCGSRADRDTDKSQSGAADSSGSLVPIDSVVIELVGSDSVTVFDLLRKSHQVDYKTSAIGVFVTAIDSVENGGGVYWLYSVNDSLPQVACDRFVTKSGDVVKWCFRKSRQ